MVETARLDALTGSPHATAFAEAPRTIRLTLDAGESVPEHRHPEATPLIHVVEGELDVAVDGETYTLDAGELLRFDGREPVSPTAREDSVAVVVLAPRSEA
jgi:quercetin dioxygenase-like cupin family protein